MRSSDFSRKWALSVGLVVLLLITMGISAVHSETNTPDAQKVREDVRPPLAPKRSDAPSSTLWRSFLWESIPSDWLSDANRQPVLQGYEHRDWKPLFITAQFDVNQGAKDLLSAIAELDSHAVDVKPFRLERLEKAIVRLERCRLALASVEGDFHDSVASPGDRPNFERGQPLAQEVPLQRYASNSPELMLPDPHAAKQKEALYREAFQAASEVDLVLVDLLVRFANEMEGNRSRAKQAKTLQGALTIRDFIQAVVPGSPRYRALHGAYARYRALAEQHPRQISIGSTPLVPGQSGAHVRDLQTRLQQEGFYEGKISGHYDAATQEALGAFQKVHGEDPDGKMGPRTREWLNTPYSQKAKMIAASLKALRQSDTRQHETYLRINIPQFKLEYVRNGVVQQTLRVIVGKASGRKIKVNGRIVGENHTPPLSSTVQQIVVNPRWYINDRIWREIAGDIEDDPTFYERHGFGRAGGYYAGGAPRVYQEPGPSNPLGQVKLEFPNDYAVYVHDTPKKYLFARSRRDFSHGCVRLENARMLAEALLVNDQNPAAPKFKNLFDTRRTTYIKLNEPVPIVIEYVTVSTDEEDHLVFCGDPYGQVEPGSS